MSTKIRNDGRSQLRGHGSLALILAWISLLSPMHAADPGGKPVAHDASTYTNSVVPFLSQHCIACHGEGEANASLRLDQLQPDFSVPESAARWAEVMDQINLGQMPPPEEPSPELEQLGEVADWIAAGVRSEERRRVGSGGRALLRRMNRTEYANTIRDLLSIRFLPGESPQDLLPPDGTVDGFDKVSTGLMVDPSLLENYFELASRIAEQVVVDGPPEFPTQTMRFELEDTAANRAIDYLCANPGIECREHDILLMDHSTRSFGEMKYGDTKKEIPVAGFYRIRVRVWGTRGADGKPVRMQVRQQHPQQDRQLLIESDITDEPQVYELLTARDPKCGEYSVSIVNGSAFQQSSPVGAKLFQAQREAAERDDFEAALRLQSRQQLEALTRAKPTPESADTSQFPKLYVDWIECEGPLYEEWPPKSHRALLFRGKGAVLNAEYVDAIFERLMRRAFRRPVSPEEVESITDGVKAEIADGEPFNQAVRNGLATVLCSPKFLYLIESEASSLPNSERDSLQAISDWGLATRLSYFLWSSMPDDELFDLARAGRLRDSGELVRQVDRMLADPKVDGLVEGFGRQWLKTDAILAFAPSERVYRDYTPKLGEAMVAEPLVFFKEVLQRDESAIAFIDSDWTMLNQPLAELYGIAGVKGDHFRRVQLSSESPRGGLLGMAGVSMAGSDGIRTKPVSRGAYVRNVLFNDPPNPPPPNVGEVEPNIRGEKLTVRERLIQHQQLASCAACHRRIDCYGLALENFNVIGQWRTVQDGEGFRGSNSPTIDASGVLPNGEAFETWAEFKHLLLKQEERFAQGLAEKMFTYATGRSVEVSDRSRIDALVSHMADHHYTLRSLIHAIVSSDPFLQK